MLQVRLKPLEFELYPSDLNSIHMTLPVEILVPGLSELQNLPPIEGADDILPLNN